MYLNLGIDVVLVLARNVEYETVIMVYGRHVINPLNWIIELLVGEEKVKFRGGRRYMTRFLHFGIFFEKSLEKKDGVHSIY